MPNISSNHKPTLHELGSSAPPSTDRLAPNVSDDPQTARLRAWAREKDYVWPGRGGTMQIGVGSVLGNLGGGPLRPPRMGETERPPDERLGLVKVDEDADDRELLGGGRRVADESVAVRQEGRQVRENVKGEEGGRVREDRVGYVEEHAMGQEKEKGLRLGRFFRRGREEQEKNVEEDVIR